MQPTIWEAEAWDPKLPGIQSPLGNSTEKLGMKGWGPHGLTMRLDPGTPKLLDIQTLLGLPELGAQCLRVMTELGKWETPA